MRDLEGGKRDEILIFSVMIHKKEAPANTSIDNPPPSRL